MEVRFISRLLDELGLCCSVDSVLHALDNGAKAGLWDARIDLGNQTLWVDYDGGYYHTSARIPRDQEKTLEKLSEHCDYVVLRIRVTSKPHLLRNSLAVMPSLYVSGSPLCVSSTCEGHR